MTHILIFLHWFVLVFTFGNVELVIIDNSKSNDFPIEELNGYTLREVFEDGNLVLNGDFSDETTGWVAYQSTFTVNSGIGSIVDDGSGIGRIQQTLSIPINTQLYVNIRLKSSSNNSSLRIRFQPYVQDNSYTNVLNTYTNKTSLYIITNNQTSFYITNLNANSVLEIDYIYMVSQSNFGISSLTVEQMNYWFNVYQENEQHEISDTYDYIENELTTNDLIYIVLFALLWGLAIKIVKGVM